MRHQSAPRSFGWGNWESVPRITDRTDRTLIGVRELRPWVRHFFSHLLIKVPRRNLTTRRQGIVAIIDQAARRLAGVRDGFVRHLALADQHHKAVVALFDCPSPNSEAFKIKAVTFTYSQAYLWHEADRFAQIIADEAERFAA